MNSGPIHLMVLMILMIFIGLVVFISSCSSANAVFERLVVFAPMYALLASVLLTVYKGYEKGMIGLVQGLGWTLVFVVTLGLGFLVYVYILLGLKACGTF